MKKLIVSIFSLGVSIASFAVTNSAASAVNVITIQDNYARISLTSMTSMEDCTKQGFYYLDLTNGKHAGTLSVLLAAKLSQSQVVIQGSGCSSTGTSGYPYISHVYLY